MARAYDLGLYLGNRRKRIMGSRLAWDVVSIKKNTNRKRYKRVNKMFLCDTESKNK